MASRCAGQQSVTNGGQPLRSVHHGSFVVCSSRFDVGYLAETYNQWFEAGTNPANGLDGYAWVEKALRLRGPDPEMEFAAALITIMAPERGHKQHVQNAWAGSKEDALLAQNLAANFAR